MKITLLAYDLSHNSLVRTHVLAQLLEYNHDVEIVGPKFEGSIWKPLRDRYEYKSVSTSSRLYAFPFDAPKLLDLVTGDVVYARKPKATSYGLALYDSLRRDRPLLLDIEDWEVGLMHANWNKYTAPVAGIPRLIDCNSYFYTRMLESLTHLADGITVSNSFLQSRFGGTVIPHLRDTDIFDSARFDIEKLRQDQGLPTDGILVMFTGTPRPHKGVDELATAVSMLDRDDVHLVVVGADNSDYVRRLERAHDDELILVEPQPFEDVPKWVAMGDIVAAPQKKVEGLHGQIPAKVFDAMALGKPVVASRISDLPDILDGCGLLVDEPTPAALAEQLARLVADPDLRETYGERARQRCVENYSLDAYVPVVDSMVESAIAGDGDQPTA